MNYLLGKIKTFGNFDKYLKNSPKGQKKKRDKFWIKFSCENIYLKKINDRQQEPILSWLISFGNERLVDFAISRNKVFFLLNSFILT